MKDDKYRLMPPYLRSALICGGVFFVVAILLGFLVFRRQFGLGGEAQTGGTDASSARPVAEAEPLGAPFVLVLDAGHGGADPGALDASETVYEATINQIITDKVMQRLAAHGQVLQVVQACPPDTNATAMQRANTAASLQADLFISLHLNADTSPYTRGFSCFPAPPGRVHHEESYTFAQMLTRQVETSGIPILGTNGIYYAYYNPTGSGFNKEIIDSAAMEGQPPKWEDSFGVVEYAGCPAVLVEQWHISSPEDMAMFYSEAGFNTMADCIYRAICEWFGLEPVG